VKFPGFFAGFGSGVAHTARQSIVVRPEFPDEQILEMRHPDGQRLRSSTGCWTCRTRKVKCDERLPVCKRCERLELTCNYAQRARKPYTSSKRRLKSHHHLNDNDHASASLTRPSPSVDDSSAATLFIRTPSLVLGSYENEAIHHYQSEFTRVHHSKTAKFNVLSMIYEIATKSEAVMHMVIVVARSELLLLRANGNSEAGSDDCCIIHYSAALGVVGNFLNGMNQTDDLDAIVAAIYLMALYEQRFSDGNGSALSTHLKGLASLIQNKVNDTTVRIV
jgi:hypothetical protein